MQPLDDRKATILRAIIRDYVSTGQPVGSQALVKRYRLRVSSATIRNEMAVLEELGYIVQPHTSAGRIPTDLGYRWFIDSWPGPTWPDLPDPERRSIDDLVGTVFDGLDETLDSTSHLLSDVTEATAFVVSPPSHHNLLKRLELLPRGSSHATALMISRDGVVEKAVVEMPKPVTEQQLEELARKITEALYGTVFEDVPAKLAELQGVDAKQRKAIAAAIERVLEARVEEKIFRGGTAKILSPDKFSDLETASQVVSALEQPDVMGELLKAAKQARTLLVFIGNEIPVQQMRTCAVVFAPYSAGSARSGTLGVIGPTRMDYPHTISAVETVANALSDILDGQD